MSFIGNPGNPDTHPTLQRQKCAYSLCWMMYRVISKIVFCFFANCTRFWIVDLWVNSFGLLTAYTYCIQYGRLFFFVSRSFRDMQKRCQNSSGNHDCLPLGESNIHRQNVQIRSRSFRRPFTQFLQQTSRSQTWTLEILTPRGRFGVHFGWHQISKGVQQYSFWSKPT